MKTTQKRFAKLNKVTHLEKYPRATPALIEVLPIALGAARAPFWRATHPAGKVTANLRGRHCLAAQFHSNAICIGKSYQHVLLSENDTSRLVMYCKVLEIYETITENKHQIFLVKRENSFY
jgi:hypothetical protein